MCHRATRRSGSSMAVREIASAPVATAATTIWPSVPRRSVKTVRVLSSSSAIKTRMTPGGLLQVITVVMAVPLRTTSGGAASLAQARPNDASLSPRRTSGARYKCLGNAPHVTVVASGNRIRTTVPTPATDSISATPRCRRTIPYTLSKTQACFHATLWSKRRVRTRVLVHRAASRCPYRGFQ